MSTSRPRVLSTTAGDLPLDEVELRVDGRVWKLFHTGALLTSDDEERFVLEDRLPYGIALWPSAIALAHDVARRAVAGKRVLELGAGTGLPGIVAASLGASVVQTDRHAVALHVCKMNAERNGVAAVEHRKVDWTEWDDGSAYDIILGSDVLYSDGMHPHLRAIFERNLAPGGTVVIADPFRRNSLRLLESMQADGWRVSFDKWTLGASPTARPIGVFELTRGLPPSTT